MIWNYLENVSIARCQINQGALFYYCSLLIVIHHDFT